MKKPLIILGVLFFIIFTLSMVQVLISNTISTKGIVLANIQKELQMYKKENAMLLEKTLVQTSFTKIASDAAEVGFVDTKSQVYLTSPLPLSLKR